MDNELMINVGKALYGIFSRARIEEMIDISALEYGTIKLFNHIFHIMQKPFATTASLKNELEKALVRESLAERLLVFDKINPATYGLLRKEGVNFCDSRGNLYLQIGSFIFENREETQTRNSAQSNNLMTEKTLRIILLLLSEPDATNFTFAKIADETGVSIGTVQRAMEVLKQNGFVFRTPNGRFLKKRRELLEIWTNGFNMVIKPKYMMGSAAFRNRAKEAEWKTILLPDGVCWGGEPAANLLDGYLVPGAFSLYTDLDYRTTCVECGIVPVPGGNITIYKKFWPGKPGPANTAYKLAVYAELMSTGNGRCIDAAKRLIKYEDFTN